MQNEFAKITMSGYKVRWTFLQQT